MLASTLLSYNGLPHMLPTFLKLLCECSPLEEGQEGESNLSRLQALHFLYATVDEGLHCIALVDFWLSVNRSITIK